MLNEFKTYIEKKVGYFQENEREKYDFDLEIKYEDEKVVIYKSGYIFVGEITKNTFAVVLVKGEKIIYDTLIDNAEREILISLKNAGYKEIPRELGMSEFIIEFENESELIEFMDKYIWCNHLGYMY